MSEFKLNEATHVCTYSTPTDYIKEGEWFYAGDTRRFHDDDPSLFNVGSKVSITDLIPEPYTGTAEEFTLDCLKRDLNAHPSGGGGFKDFCRDHLGRLRYSYFPTSCTDNLDIWHPVPIHRGTVSQGAKDPKNRELAGLDPLQNIAVEKMIEHDQLSREDFDAGVRSCLKDIAKICGARFGVDVGYESLPDLVKSKVAPVVQEWDGEGLPPVGVECEMQNANGVFIDVEIIANKDGYAFGWSEACMVYFSNQPHEFRPIRTDREKAIDDAKLVLAHIMHTHERPDEEAAMYLVDSLDEGLMTGYGKL